ncbi:MAG: hypothetical protein KA354_05860 [Phycisphaerae bacterium]|nr:hypothetical protein [Phycisphaerae bacterium]
MRFGPSVVGVMCAVHLWLSPSPAVGQYNWLVNGDWSAGETGWNRWAAPWSSGSQWLLAIAGTSPPAGRLHYSAGTGEHGWFQRVNVMPDTYSIQGDWSGILGVMGWAQVMLFSGTAGLSDAELLARIEGQVIGDIVAAKDSWGLNPPSDWDWEPITNSLHPGGNGNQVFATDGQVVVVVRVGTVAGFSSAMFDNLQLVGGGSGFDLTITEPSDLPDPPAPVDVTISFTATASTQYGGIATVGNGAARSEGFGWGTIMYSYSGANVLFKKSVNGQARGAARLRGEEGMEEGPPMCMEWDPFTGDCLFWGPPEMWPVPSGWAEGQVTGVLTLGTSAAHPAGSPLEMLLSIRCTPWSSYAQTFSLQLSRAGTRIADLNQNTSSDVIVPVFAGEALEFSHSAYDSSGYFFDTSFFYLFVLTEGPPPPEGACCFYDGRCEQLSQVACTAAHGRVWTQDAACEPNLCPPPLPADFDFDGDVDRDDLTVFAGCYSGPAIPYSETATCQRANFDKDGDVDMVDFGVFQRCFCGAGEPGNPACAD